MEQHLKIIRMAIATDATQEARAAGAHACKSILSALEPAPQVPAAPQPQMPTPPLPVAQIAELAGALRSIPIDQLLDLAIVKLRTALPQNAAPPEVPRLNFQYVPLAGSKR